MFGEADPYHRNYRGKDSFYDPARGSSYRAAESLLEALSQHYDIENRNRNILNKPYYTKDDLFILKYFEKQRNKINTNTNTNINKIVLDNTDYDEEYMKVYYKFSTRPVRKYSSFHRAVENHDYNRIVYFIDKKGYDVDTLNDENITVLQIAIEYNYIKIVKYLIEMGADVNINIKSSNVEIAPPLHMALDNNSDYYEIVKLLLKNNADVNLLYDHTDTFYEEFDFTDDISPLHVASFWNNTDAVKLLIEMGADVNALAGGETTPFHIACEYGRVGVANILLRNGANINTNTMAGFDCRPPLMRAIETRCFDTVQFLLNNYANMDYVDTWIDDGDGETVHTTVKTISTSRKIDDLINVADLKEWRPWNHNKYPIKYRDTMRTVVCLAKIE